MRIGKFYTIPPLILQTLAWGPTWLLLKFFCKFEVKGYENLKDIKQAIFAVNHSSELDPIILTAALPPLGRFAPMFYISRDRNRYDKVKFGWRWYLYGETFFNAWGAYNAPFGLKDYAKTLTTHAQILRDGNSLCIFPEGKRTEDGNMGEAHGGVAYLLYETNCPVIPVYIKEAFNLTVFEFIMKKQKIMLTFGKAVIKKDIFQSQNFEDYLIYKEGAKKIMDKITELITQK